MPDADVLYSDVKFTKTRENANGTVPSSAEATYSEVKITKAPQASTELPGPQQKVVSNGGSKVTSERVAVAVLCVLLVASLIALGFTTVRDIQSTENLQKLTEEHEAVKKNLTETLEKVRSCHIMRPTCPTFPVINLNEPCPKCEAGWERHGRQCYYFSTDEFNWEDSRDRCRDQGGDLVKIDSRDEQSFLELRLREKMVEDEDKFWIGLTDSEREDTWLWADGSPLNTSLTFWSRGEPDNWKGKEGDNPEGEDCVRMGERGGPAELKCWFDKFCKEPHKRICEKEAETGRLQCV